MKLEVAICNLKFMVGRRRRQTFVERDTQVTELVPIVQRPIEQVIVLIRNEKVILDVDLASLYGVTVVA